jgi:hypothetical protein
MRTAPPRCPGRTPASPVCEASGRHPWDLRSATAAAAGPPRLATGAPCDLNFSALPAARAGIVSTLATSLHQGGTVAAAIDCLGDDGAIKVLLNGRNSALVRVGEGDAGSGGAAAPVSVGTINPYTNPEYYVGHLLDGGAVSAHGFMLGIQYFGTYFREETFSCFLLRVLILPYFCFSIMSARTKRVSSITSKVLFKCENAIF